MVDDDVVVEEARRAVHLCATEEMMVSGNYAGSCFASIVDSVAVEQAETMRLQTRKETFVRRKVPFPTDLVDVISCAR